MDNESNVSDEQKAAPDVEAQDTDGAQDDKRRPGETDKEASLANALHAERQTIKELKQQLASLTKAQEEQRLASLSEQERALEEARAAGRQEAMSEVRRDLVRAQVTAAAAAAGFADPADASGFLPLDDLDSEDAVKAAVEELSKVKPYLLRKQPTVQVPQGPQGGTVVNDDPNEWLRGAFRR